MATKIKSTGIADLTTDISLVDNAKILVGTGDDLQIYHDSNNSYIDTAGGSTGDLYIRAQGTSHDLILRAADNIYIQPQGNDNGITVTGDGPVILYHNSSEKLTTTTTGVTITGTAVATAFSGPLTGNVTGAITTSTIYNAANNNISIFSGGNASNAGANLSLYGGTNANAGDFRFRSGTTVNLLLEGDGTATFTGAVTATTYTGALASTVTAATQSANDNTTKVATTAWVQTELTDLIDGAPGTLDTLNELAAAINDDSNYNSTLTTALATKLPLAGGTMTGQINMNSNNLSGINNATAVSFLSTNGYWVGGTQRMNGSGNLLNIGTISSGAITSTGNFSLNKADGFAYLSNVGTGNSGIYVRGIGSNGTLRSHTTTDFRWEVTGSEKMKLDSSGNLNVYNGAAIKVYRGGNSASAQMFMDTGERLFIRNSYSNLDIVFTREGNLGLGTTSPNTKLHVLENTASVYGAARFQYNGDNNYEVIRLESLGNYDCQIGFFADGDTNYYGGFGIDYSDAGKFKLQTDNLFAGGTNLMTWARDGKVGIGTTSPDARLSIYTNTGSDPGLSTGGIRVHRPGSFGQYGWIDYGYASSTMYIGSVYTGGTSSNYGIIRFQQTSSGATRDSMILDSVGNVGIGTTSPDERLHISGQASIEGAGNTNRGNLILGAHGNGSDKWATLAGTHYNDVTGSGNGDGNAGCMIIGSSSDSSNNTIHVGGGPYELNPATSIKFYTHTATTHNLGGTTRMIIDSSGDVGIGTTNPAQKLHVAGGHIHLDTGMAITWDNTHERIEQADAKLEFFTNNAQSMTLSGSNLGIGTTNPKHPLSVHLTNGELAMFGSNAQNSVGQYAGIGLGQVLANNTTYQKIAIVAEGRGNGNYISNLHFLVDIAADSGSAVLADSKMMISGASGNVGIGTTNPPYKLVVSNGGASGIEFGPAYSGTTNLVQHYNRATSSYVDVNTSALQHKFYTGSTFAAMIDSSGNVGIGTASPDVILHLKSTTAHIAQKIETTVSTGNATLSLLAHSVGDSAIYFGDNTDGDVGSVFYDHTDNYLAFTTNTAERMRVDSAGNLIYGGSGGVNEKYFSGNSVGSTAFSHDITHTDDSGQGTFLHIQATFTHHPSYDCILDTWVTRRGSTFTSTVQFRRDTATSGNWQVAYVDATTTRITHVAGNYAGGGPYWIKATWKNR